MVEVSSLEEGRSRSVIGCDDKSTLRVCHRKPVFGGHESQPVVGRGCAVLDERAGLEVGPDGVHTTLVVDNVIVCSDCEHA